MLLCGVALLAAFVLNIASGMAMIRQGHQGIPGNKKQTASTKGGRQ